VKPAESEARAFSIKRWSVYEACIEAIRQRPWRGSFADLLPSLRSAEISGWGIWDFAYSTILEIAVEMGLPV
jgi:O-antigen ligase